MGAKKFSRRGKCSITQLRARLLDSIDTIADFHVRRHEWKVHDGPETKKIMTDAYNNSVAAIEDLDKALRACIK